MAWQRVPLLGQMAVHGRDPLIYGQQMHTLSPNDDGEASGRTLLQSMGVAVGEGCENGLAAGSSVRPDSRALAQASNAREAEPDSESTRLSCWVQPSGLISRCHVCCNWLCWAPYRYLVGQETIVRA